MPGARKRGSTLAQVAGEAGVSHTVAGKVLNRTRSTTRVAPETAERIRQAAERLGYRRNAAAHAWRSGRFGTIAVCGRADLGPEHHRVLRHAIAQLEAQGRHVLATDIDELRFGDPEYTPSAFRELRVDGLLLHFNHNVRPDDVRAVAALGVPAVWLNSCAAVDAVVPDDEGAGTEAARWLLAAGHRHLALLGTRPATTAHPLGPHHSHAARERGVTAACAAAGARLELVDPPAAGGTIADHAVHWDRLVATHHHPSAWIIDGEALAWQLVHALLRAGRRIPETVSLVVLDGGRRNDLGPLSHLRLPLGRMMAAAIAMLDAKIAKPHEHRTTVSVPCLRSEGWTVAGPCG